VNLTGVFNVFSITDFVNGTLANGSNVTQNFAGASHYQFNNYSLGMYAQDEWKAKPNLTFTLALRADRNSKRHLQARLLRRI